MAQGAVKKSGGASAPKATHSKRQASKVSKKSKSGNSGSKAKGKLSGDRALHRKFTAGMAARTEALLGERAGHLELIGKGKKAEKKEGKKGGSKKFG